MIDWTARIDDLAFHLSSQYRMEDRGGLEVLLCALIPCPRTQSCWLTLETNWFSRDCGPGWFSLGETWLPESLPLLRAMRPRDANQRIAAWLAEPPVPRLFVEPDFDRRLPRYGLSTKSLSCWPARSACVSSLPSMESSARR